MQATLVADPAGSQIQPAIDFDGSGNTLMTYYSTQNYPPQNTTDVCWQVTAACTSYQLFALSISPAGAVTGPTLINGGPYGNAYIGDYHDTFFFTYPSTLGSIWNTSWTQNTGTYAAPAEDVWLTGLK